MATLRRPRTQSFTRPADTTAYTSGDLVANSTTAGSVAPLEYEVLDGSRGSLIIRRCRIRKSQASTGTFRVHFYQAAPTPTNGDNGVWLTNQSANYLGSMDVSIEKVFSDGAIGNGVPANGTEILVDTNSGGVIYVLLEARSAYTPTSGETFEVTLEDIE